MKYFLDNCGTVSYGDAGRDYLSGLLGMSRQEFMNAVRDMRSSVERDPAYRKAFREQTGVEHQHSLELAAMLVQKGISRDAVREIGRYSRNSIREGFLDFLQGAAPGEVYIVSAAPHDWLKYFWEKYSDKPVIMGTRLSADENGIYDGIAIPRGRDGKPETIRPYINGGAVVGVGDTSGDELMLSQVRDAGGLVITFGPEIRGDIEVHPDADWSPAWAAMELFAEHMGERQAALPRHDPSAIRPMSELGDRIVKGLKHADRI